MAEFLLKEYRTQNKVGMMVRCAVEELKQAGHIQSFTPKIFTIPDVTQLSQDSTEQKYSKAHYREIIPIHLIILCFLYDVTYYCSPMHLLSAAPYTCQANKIEEQLPRLPHRGHGTTRNTRDNALTTSLK